MTEYLSAIFQGFPHLLSIEHNFRKKPAPVLIIFYIIIIRSIDHKQEITFGNKYLSRKPLTKGDIYG